MRMKLFSLDNNLPAACRCTQALFDVASLLAAGGSGVREALLSQQGLVRTHAPPRQVLPGIGILLTSRSATPCSYATASADARYAVAVPPSLHAEMLPCASFATQSALPWCFLASLPSVLCRIVHTQVLLARIIRCSQALLAALLHCQNAFLCKLCHTRC